MLVQLLGALLTAASVVVAVVIWSRQHREARRAAHQGLVIATCRDLTLQMDLASAELMPFWKDPATRRRHAGVAAEIAVHRHVHQVLSGRLLLDATLAMWAADDAAEQAEELRAAGQVCEAAVMALYLALVPTPRDALSVEDSWREFLNRLTGRARAMGVDLIVKTNQSTSAVFAQQLSDGARKKLLESTAAYVRSIG